MTNNNFEKVITMIESANNDMFRVADKNNVNFIHDNQVNAAKEIVKAFNNNITRRNHVMLVARMQSGKTGVCNCVVNIINGLKLDIHMGVDKFFFITGMNDCGLKSQTYDRVLKQVIGAKATNTYTGKRASRNNVDNRYYVMKNSDLLAFEGDINNSVIFIDECHYGSGDKNILSRFLYKQKIDWKNTNELIARNIYIVSVSATPFGELISDTKECKQCVELKTNDDYVGVSQYKNNGLIHNGNFEDKVGDITVKLADAIGRMKDARGNEYNEYGVCMVRTRDFDSFKSDEFTQYNFDVYEMFSNGSKIEYDRLVDKIFELKAINEHNAKWANCSIKVLREKNMIKAKPILVLIKGAYRAGITLPSELKDMIYMVYDYSIKSAATAQALLGRMCGYRPKDTILKTHFYINNRASDMYSTWESDFSNRENIPCDKVMQSWLESVDDIDSYTDVELGSKSCGNFAITLSDSEIEEIFAKCNGKKTCHSNMKSLLPQILENHGISITYDYLNEAHIQGKNNYAVSSQNKRFDSFSENSLVFGFRPDKIKEFMDATGRDYLTTDDFGKRCVSVVLDADIDKTSGKVIGGNKRLLVYYVEVGAFRFVPNQKCMFEVHKWTGDTASNI